ncbi:hypothetical protein ACFX2J_005476 [Malus domestica]
MSISLFSMAIMEHKARLIFLDDESSDERGKEEVKIGRYFPIIPMVLVKELELGGVPMSPITTQYTSSRT